MASNDPFYLVRDDIQASLDRARAAAGRWRSLPRGAAERARLEAEVDDECRSIAWQLDEVEKAVGVAERNAARFGLTPQEVAARRAWAAETRSACGDLSASLAAARDAHTPARRPPPRDDAASKLAAAAVAENDGFLGQEGERQAMILRKQDAELDELGHAVVRIGEVGLAIHDELHSQTAALDALADDVDATGSRLAAAQRKVAVVLQKAGLKAQLAIAGALLVLLVILTLIAFS